MNNTKSICEYDMLSSLLDFYALFLKITQNKRAMSRLWFSVYHWTDADTI
jgi:hypothetical protein